MKLDNYPMKESGLFILKKTDLDNIAESVLRENMPWLLNYPQAVDVNYLAEEYFGLSIRHEYLSMDGRILGLIAFSDTEFSTWNLENEPEVINVEEGTMLIDMRLIGDKNLGRKRFTIAHEVSHWICHRSFHSPTNKLYDFRKSLIACRSEDIEQEKMKFGKKHSDEFWEEWQADTLAASLLMPKSTFLEAVNESIHQHNLKRNIGKQGLSDYDVKQVVFDIMKIFKVSNRAAQIRLVQLGLVQNK